MSKDISESGKLPDIIPTGRKSQHYNLTYVGIPCVISEQDPDFSRFIYKLKTIVANERRMFIIDSVPRMASINWVRDHVHIMKGYKHWEYDLKSFIEYTILNQSPEGIFYKLMSPINDGHTGWAYPECIKRDETNNLAFIHIEVEADVEYLVVEGAATIYRVTGDSEWISRMLPALEKAINYCTSSPKRWDPETGLVKRPFTIDTYDWKYNADSRTIASRVIGGREPMSIMHGDNSGVYQAMWQLAWINGRLGREDAKCMWEERAEKLKDNLNRTCWNGRFYTHQVHLGHEGCKGIDETQMLSMSNAYDMNRGVASHEQICSIINEYRSRKDTAGTFAEWFTINPVYPGFGGVHNERCAANTYVNGSITPITAGELAKAAFNNGFEAYGLDIVRRLRAMVEKDDDLFFFYDPFSGKGTAGGKKSLDPSGWGAAAVISAIEEGLAGITDTGVKFDTMDFSPRWPVTGENRIKYITGYEMSKVLVECVYTYDRKTLSYVLSCPSDEIRCHILLPDDKGRRDCRGIRLNGCEIDYRTSEINDSVYADFTFRQEGINHEPGDWQPQKRNLIEILF